jgi:disulfide oxidoreductase YuzD
MKRKLFILPLVLMMIFAFTACAVNQFTPKQKASLFMGMYNSQFYDYMTVMGYGKNASGDWVQVNKPTFNDDQKRMLMNKRDILDEVYPLILVYDEFVGKGITPDRQTEQTIMDLLNKLP